MMIALNRQVGFTDAQELAQEVDNLRSGGRVRLLNFAYISLKKSAPLLGTGSFSKVYAGEYRGQPVAIKMLFTPDLNPEVIRRCCNEAQLLSRIQHPNIVTIYGVAVLPPSVCIVLEKCEFGSLADVLRG
jgi:serine/threonine protein kinase